MRSRYFYFYLCIAFTFFCSFLLLICKQTPTSSVEPLWLQESRSDLLKRHQIAVSSLNPDLAWLKKLGKDALSTIPVRSPNCSHAVFLTILVASSPGNFKQRNALRSSWGKVRHSTKNQDSFRGVLGSYRPDHVLKTVFLLGRSTSDEIQALVDIEMQKYDDIVFGEFEDKYEHLVFKTRLGLTWTYSNCPSSYVLKTDDDVFLSTWQLLRWIVRSEEHNLYTGWCNYRSKVSRNKLSKW